MITQAIGYTMNSTVQDSVLKMIYDKDDYFFQGTCFSMNHQV